jgi:hypothetical protein
VYIVSTCVQGSRPVQGQVCNLYASSLYASSAYMLSACMIAVYMLSAYTLAAYMLLAYMLAAYTHAAYMRTRLEACTRPCVQGSKPVVQGVPSNRSLWPQVVASSLSICTRHDAVCTSCQHAYKARGLYEAVCTRLKAGCTRRAE